MDSHVKAGIVMILTIALSTTVVVSTASAIASLAVRQRHAFLLKCMAELGSNNIELCSSIAK